MTDPPRRSPNLIIRASAGTGKTFQLVHRFIRLLRGGAAADRVLATTFTRKAAGEILQRVVLRLAAAAADDAARREMGRFIGEPELPRAACVELLAQLLDRLHRLRISTLDSLFLQMARSQSLELGIPVDWRIVDELQESALRSDALQAALGRDKTSDLLALTHLLTKGEASRGVGDLVRATVDDLYELFAETGKPAWHTIPRHKPLEAPALAATVDALSSAAVADKTLAKARDEDCLRAVRQDWEAFIEKGLAAKVAAGAGDYRRKPIPTDVVTLYQPLVEHARAVLVGRVALQTEGSFQLLQAFDQQYRRLKRNRRALRFDDVTRTLAESSLRGGQQQSAEWERLAFRLDGGIDHLLLDEFQDTAPAQWHAIRRLAEHACGDDPRRSFFCVGDVKQAIYGWRGGVAEIFDVISRQLPGLETLALNKSFRSSPAVIDTVNRVFTGLARHPNLQKTAPAVKTWSDAFALHETARTELPGYACLVTAPAAGPDQTQAAALLDFVVGRIAGLTSEAPGRSVGVLVRRNETVGRLIGLLRRQGVRASEEGGNALTDSAAVQLLLSLLRLGDHPGDTVARFHVATSPLGRHVGFTEFRDDQAARQLAQQVRRALLDRGYGPTLMAWARRLAAHASAAEVDRLEQLVELAYIYQSSASLRADDFVDFVEHQRVSERLSADVRVMTIHQAKGLEFDIVVLPELDAHLVGQPGSFVVHRPDPTQPADRVCRYVNESLQRLLPAAVQQMFADTTNRTVSESLCVLYVALTRAAHALHMVIGPSAGNERTLPRTFAGLLRAALFGTDPVPAGSLLFEHGDAAWFRHLPALDQPRPEPAPETSGPIRLAAPEGRRRHGLQRISPSGLEGGSRTRITQLLRRDASAALLHGSIFHAWFEQIEWLDDAPPPADRLREVAGQLLGSNPGGVEVDLEQLLGQFQEMLARAEVGRLLSRDGYLADWLASAEGASGAASHAAPRLVVENERPFAVRDREDRLLTGFIDRLVLVFRGQELAAAEVIDYKTDTVTGGDQQRLRERVEFYRPQLQAYCGAVQTMTGLDADRVGARLVFVRPGIVQRL